MPWIKKNPHLVVLLVVALLVIAASAFAALNARSFNEKFVPAQQRVIPGEKIEPLDVTVLDETQKELEKPAIWAADLIKQPPFVPPRYSIQDGHPVKAGIGAHWVDPLTKKFIDDKWFMDHGLNVTDPTIATQDRDGDGFSNADEWRENTDPQNPNSHPPYYTKLYLKKFIQVPFRLKFNSYDGDPKKDKPEDLTFQINTLEYRSPSVFLHIGDNVFKDKFKIIKFEFKEKEN